MNLSEYKWDQTLHRAGRCGPICGYCHAITEAYEHARSHKRTKAEESLIRAAIEFVERTGLVRGKLVEAVDAVKREREP